MSNLIDRQKLIDMFTGLVLYADLDGETKSYMDGLTNAYNLICQLPSAEPEIIRCKDCQWGREVCGNIECSVDSNIPSEYYGYEWFCPNGEKKKDE